VDVELKKFVDEMMEEFNKYDEVIGYADVDLETRFVKVRTQETNYGNFLVDLVRNYYDADVALINSGMVRNDVVIPAGRLTYSKISNIIDAQMIVKKVKGKALLEALEMSVGLYPEYSGQFLFVSGIKFTFDHTKTPRVQQV
jgi:5'-nucleotidase